MLLSLFNLRWFTNWDFWLRQMVYGSTFQKTGWASESSGVLIKKSRGITIPDLQSVRGLYSQDTELETCVQMLALYLSVTSDRSQSPLLCGFFTYTVDIIVPAFPPPCITVRVKGDVDIKHRSQIWGPSRFLGHLSDPQLGTHLLHFRAVYGTGQRGNNQNVLSIYSS